MVREVDRVWVDSLKQLKKKNGISNCSTSLVMSLNKGHKTAYSLGQYLRNLQANPDEIPSNPVFEIIQGNHCFLANKEVVYENPDCPKGFHSLRCNFIVNTDRDDVENTIWLRRVRNVSRL